MRSGNCLEATPNYSTRWRLIKRQFTRLWREHGGHEGIITPSRTEKKERGIWQRRFYEHTCRDEDDLQRCLDDLHVNPLRHGLVQAVKDWRWSSFHRYVRLGVYPEDWGVPTNGMVMSSRAWNNERVGLRLAALG